MAQYTAVYMFMYTGRIQRHVHGPWCIQHVHGHVHCTRANTTSTWTVHGRLGLYTARSRPRNGRVHVHTCTRNTAITRPCTRRVHGPKRPCARPSTRPVNSRAHRPCARPVHGRVHVRVHELYTQPSARPIVYTARTRPCTRADKARTSPCTRPVHGHVSVHVYTCIRAVYTGRVLTLTQLIIYTVHTRPFTQADTARTRSCTRPCSRPVHGRVHVCTYTRAENGRYTAVLRRLCNGSTYVKYLHSL